MIENLKKAKRQIFSWEGGQRAARVIGRVLGCAFLAASVAACAVAQPRNAAQQPPQTSYDQARAQLQQEAIKQAELNRQIPPQSWAEGGRRLKEDVAKQFANAGLGEDERGNHTFSIPFLLHMRQEDGGTGLAQEFMSHFSVSVTTHNQSAKDFSPTIKTSVRTTTHQEDGTDENGMTIFKQSTKTWSNEYN